MMKWFFQAARKREQTRLLSDGDGRIHWQGADHHGQRLRFLQVVKSTIFLMFLMDILKQSQSLVVSICVHPYPYCVQLSPDLYLVAWVALMLHYFWLLFEFMIMIMTMRMMTDQWWWWRWQWWWWQCQELQTNASGDQEDWWQSLLCRWRETKTKGYHKHYVDDDDNVEIMLMMVMMRRWRQEEATPWWQWNITISKKPTCI